MQAHLAEISATVAPDAHAVLLLDQAGWHLAGALVVPGNITLLPLPPRSPELNPVENVWQFLRDNWLSNRVFNGYDDIVAHCCAAWNDLIDQPWRIRSIGRARMGGRVLINAGWYKYNQWVGRRCSRSAHTVGSQRRLRTEPCPVTVASASSVALALSEDDVPAISAAK